MKLVTFRHAHFGSAPRVGMLQGDRVLDVAPLLGNTDLNSMHALLQLGPDGIATIDSAASEFAAMYRDQLEVPREIAVPAWEVRLLPPVPEPASFRDFYAFEGHVANAFAKRGRPIPQPWYDNPVFYFGNHGAFKGPDADIPYPAGTSELDFELELALVIGRPGRNISADRALEHVAGYTILNDWSARDLQRQEMSVGLGPAKGKDFATSIGPYLVTGDELADRFSAGRLDLTMIARINGEEIARGNTNAMYWTVAQLIERASLNVDLAAGDLIATGTLTGGSLFDLGEAVHPWLQIDDEVELEIERLGRLRNRVSAPIALHD